MCVHDGSNYSNQGNAANTGAYEDARTSEQVMTDMMREDLGVTINAQAWRMFLRYRWGRFTPLAHRIHEGKR